MNILFLGLVSAYIYDFNAEYSNIVLDIRNNISEVSEKIESGEMLLSPLQYSNVLNEANDWTLYFVHINILSIISLLFYGLSVCSFYMGMFVGKRNNSL
jgi:hypothetical protein